MEAHSLNQGMRFFVGFILFTIPALRPPPLNTKQDSPII